MDYERLPYPGFYEPGDAYQGADEAEVELAYLMHNAEPGDPRLAFLLVERYSADVKRLVTILLDDPGLPLVSSVEIWEVLQQIFAKAVSQVYQFRGEENVRTWILALAYSKAREFWHARKLRHYFQDFHPEQGEQKLILLSADIQQVTYWTSLDHLPELQRLSLVLRYVFKLPVKNIAYILNTNVEKVQKNLAAGRHHLLVNPGNPHQLQLIHAKLDGILKEFSSESQQLDAHLAECLQCRKYVDRLQDLDKKLTTGLQKRWPAPILTTTENEQLAKGAIDIRMHKWVRIPLSASLRKIAWFAGMMFIFGLSIGYFILFRPEEPDYTVQPTAIPTPMPTPIDVSGRDGLAGTRNVPVIGSGTRVQFVESSLSADGNTLAFTLVSLYQESSQTILNPELYVYNLQSGAFWRVSAAPAPVEDQFKFLNLSPSLSPDGRWLTYGSRGNSQVPGGDYCYTGEGEQCMDIFIVDQSENQTDLITRGYDGSPANNDSFAPTISADGRWVAFWSSASNLVEEKDEICGIGATSESCLNIYLYDRKAKEIHRIPLGTASTEDIFGFDRISLSADGRYIGFSVGSEDKLAEELNITQPREAVIYDRQSGEYRLVNQTLEGILGNGPSFSPILSANGQTVAFASSSSNLVIGDTNNVTDIFVKDLQSGFLERVNLSTEGQQGDDHSGWIFENTGFYGLNLSGDARFVVFLSRARTLDQGEQGCYFDGEVACNAVYVHDRRTGITERVADMETSHFYLFPEVSSDGRFVSYVEFIDDSEYGDLYSQLMLYDQQRGWTSNLTWDRFKPTKVRWSELRTIETTPDELYGLAFSPDSQMVATSHYEPVVKVWDVNTRTLAYTLKSATDAAVLSVAFSPDGELLAAGTMDGMVNIWLLAEKRRIFALGDHKGSVHTVVFSPDSKELVVGTEQEITFWQRGEGKFILTNQLEYPEGSVAGFALSPEGNLLAVAMEDDTVWLQLLPSGILLSRLGGHTSNVIDVTFSPDGTLLASRSLDGMVNLWQVGWQGFGALTVEHLDARSGASRFGRLVFSPDGEYLIFDSINETIESWKVSDGAVQYLYPNPVYSDIISEIAISPDGSRLAAGMQGMVALYGVPGSAESTRFFLRDADDVITQTVTDHSPLIDDWPDAIEYAAGDENNHLTLYEADARVNIDILTPDRIPLNMSFSEARLTADGGVMLQYQVSPPEGAGSGSTLYIHEVPSSGVIAPQPIGASAEVEITLLGLIRSEYVRGDWIWLSNEVSGTNSYDLYQWDLAQPVQRLRWQYSGILTSFYYRTYEQGIESDESINGFVLPHPYNVQGSLPDFALNQEDIVQIAESMSPLPLVAPSDPILITYTVHEGDTCTGIAENYGTKIQTITNLNRLAETCDLIYVGQKLRIHLSNERLLFEEADLDCNGLPERIQVIPARNTSGQAVVFGIALEMLDDRGLYTTVWQDSIVDEASAYLGYPQLFGLENCHNFLTFPVLGGEQPGLRVYHLNEGELSLVLSSIGFQVGPVIVGGDNRTITTQMSTFDAAVGTCQVLTSVYTWDGQVFTQISQTMQSDPTCTQR